MVENTNKRLKMLEGHFTGSQTAAAAPAFKDCKFKTLATQ